MSNRLQSLRIGSTAGWLVLVSGAVYVLFAGWLMAAASYDIWGVLVATPFAAVDPFRKSRSVVPS